MFCTECGIEILQGNASCSECGAPAVIPVMRAAGTAGGAAPPAHRIAGRPRLFTVLAVWQFIKAILLFTGVAGFSLYLRDLENPPHILLQIAVLAGFACLCGLAVAGGIGLLKLRPYGRTILLAFAWLELVFFPIGTAISIFLFLYLRKPEIKSLFAAQRNEQTSAGALISRPLVFKLGVVLVLATAIFFVAISMTVPSQSTAEAGSTYAPFSVVILSEDAQSVVDDSNTVTERDVADLVLAMDENGSPSVSISFTQNGAAKMEVLTRNNVGRRIAFAVNGEIDRTQAPVIGGVTSGNASVTFNSMDEANEFIRRLKTPKVAK